MYDERHRRRSHVLLKSPQGAVIYDSRPSGVRETRYEWLNSILTYLYHFRIELDTFKIKLDILESNSYGTKVSLGFFRFLSFVAPLRSFL